MFRYKFKKTDNLFSIGCLHLQHVNITRGVSSWNNKENMTRDFQTVEEMTANVLASIQSVPEDAHLFILGDMLFGDKSKIYSILDSIQCKNLYYIFGNHDEWMRKEQYSDLSNYFKWMGDYLEIFWGGKLIIMSHYPFSVWNESHKNSWMLCSHSHGSFMPSRPETTTHGKVLDCGWDVHNRPISMTEIETIMDKKTTAKPDHHGPHTN